MKKMKMGDRKIQKFKKIVVIFSKIKCHIEELLYQSFRETITESLWTSLLGKA